MNDVYESCVVETTMDQKYLPIDVHNATYIIHRQRKVNFFQICNGTQDIIRPLDWAYSIEIPPGCALRANDEIMPGPLYASRSVHEIRFGPVSITNGLQPKVQLQDLAETINEYNHTASMTPKPTVKYDIRKVTDLSRKAREAISHLQGQLDDVVKINQEIAQPKYDVFVLVKQLDNVIYGMILTALALGSIRSSKWLYVITPSVTVIHSAEAFSIFATDTWIWSDVAQHLTTFLFDRYFIILKFAMLIVGILSLFFINWVYKVEMSYHTATCYSPIRSRFYLEITLSSIKESLCRTHVSLITIRKPVLKRMHSQTSAMIVIKPENLWFNDVRGKFTSLAEPVGIRGLYEDGRYSLSAEEHVLFDWNKLEWRGEHVPNSFLTSGYGTCTIRIIPDPSIIRHRYDTPSSPPSTDHVVAGEADTIV